ncbi:substrate-binding domain-containing protein [uncultured Victivallis sp.]|uniref:substrate-binding domain-containing protein n=1 Tax=uncultured Victivallis sp. TaxID=354118 RepID=UPI00338E19A6
MAQGIYRAAKRLKLEIGRDLTVTGFDDLPMARRLTPPLTSVRSPQGEIGYQAAALLHRLAAGELNVPVHLRVPTELIERASC